MAVYGNKLKSELSRISHSVRQVLRAQRKPEIQWYKAWEEWKPFSDGFICLNPK